MKMVCQQDKEKLIQCIQKREVRLEKKPLCIKLLIISPRGKLLFILWLSTSDEIMKRMQEAEVNVFEVA